MTTEGEAILEDLAGLFAEGLAWGAWGRLLVEVARSKSGAVVVSEIAVEEIVGDEALVDAAFESPDARACLPAVARAVEALSALEGLDPLLLGGGTFVRVEASGDGAGRRLAFLPGLVRAPSPSIDTRRIELGDWLRETGGRLREVHGIDASVELETDMVLGTVRALVAGEERARGHQVVLGSFSRSRRSWVWGAHNPTLADAARARASRVLDELPDRAPWEIATPGLTTDEPTAWLLAALVAEAHRMDGVVRVGAGVEGFVLLGLSGLGAPPRTHV